MSPTNNENLNFSPTALQILHDRYLWRDDQGNATETPKQMLMRVAGAIAQGDKKKEKKYYAMMERLDFLPNSPTLMNAGREGIHGQLAACYVLGIEDSMQGIFETLGNQALIHKSGGGTGFNFSTLRPKNAPVRSTNGRSSGPVSFMELFDIATEKVQQGGMRRGANMAILNVDHPDIHEFITAKATDGKLANFNLSVGITDAFMKQVMEAEPGAIDIWRKLVTSAWATGDPGIIFLDALEKGNPTPHLGKLDTTNPCGESPLYPNEACNLGSINVSNFYEDGQFDWPRFTETIHTAVQFLDAVIDVNHYPLPIIEETVKRTRKIGLGIMGFADLLYKMGISYDSKQAQRYGGRLMEYIKKEAHVASAELGVYPAYDPKHSKHQPRKNATLTCIAPTGTISLLAECSSGIEPVFALTHTRKYTNKEGQTETITIIHPEYQKALDDKNDPRYGIDVFVTAHDIPTKTHIHMQAEFQRHTDLAVSKTINMPNTATVNTVANAYLLAWELGCKGTTIYRDGSKANQVLTHACPECGGEMKPSDGCSLCVECGYSPCGV